MCALLADAAAGTASATPTAARPASQDLTVIGISLPPGNGPGHQRLTPPHRLPGCAWKPPGSPPSTYARSRRLTKGRLPQRQPAAAQDPPLPGGNRRAGFAPRAVLPHPAQPHPLDDRCADGRPPRGDAERLAVRGRCAFPIGHSDTSSRSTRRRTLGLRSSAGIRSTRVPTIASKSARTRASPNKLRPGGRSTRRSTSLSWAVLAASDAAEHPQVTDATSGRCRLSPANRPACCR